MRKTLALLTITLILPALCLAVSPNDYYAWKASQHNGDGNRSYTSSSSAIVAVNVN